MVRRNQQAGRLISIGDDLVEMLRHAAFDGPGVDWRRVLGDVLRGGKPQHFDAVPQRRGDGSERFFRILIAPLTGSGVMGGMGEVGGAGVSPASRRGRAGRPRSRKSDQL